MDRTEQRLGQWAWPTAVVVLMVWIGVLAAAAEKEDAPKAGAAAVANVKSEGEAVISIDIWQSDDLSQTEEQIKTQRELQEAELKKIMERIEAERRAQYEQIRNDPAWQTTHEEVRVIRVADGGQPLRLHNFCLDRRGNILAACGGTRMQFVSPGGGAPDTLQDAAAALQVQQINDPGQIRVYTPEGKLVDTWPVPFEPQALCVHTDGTIFVGGDGRLARLSADGRVIKTADSPAVVAARPQPKTTTAGQEDTVEKVDDAAKRKDVASKDQKSSTILRALIRAIFGRADEKVEEAEDAGQVPSSQRVLLARAKQITGMAVTDRDVFIACRMVGGYGYAVWRTDHEFDGAEKIVEGLRGCCGQMDVQAHQGELWVPENGRHRVLHCDRDGNELSRFGQRSRAEASGFGGCCEPKNLRFGPGGELYVAESGPPVAIKRFSPEGEFLGVVGLPEFSTGCVRVSVEVSQDGSHVFILNTGERAIHVLADKRRTPTHRQLTTFGIPAGDQPARIHTFCVDSQGNLLAGCGGEELVYTAAGGAELVARPAAIKVLKPDGELAATWELDLTPQAINVAPDGVIYVGGQGRLAKLDAEGNLLMVVDAPHLANLPPLPEIPEDEELDPAEAEAKREKIAQLTAKHQAAMKAFKEAARGLRAGQDDQQARKTAAARLKTAAARYQEAMNEYVAAMRELEAARLTPRGRALQQRAAALRKRRITGIGVTDQDVFVACPMVETYGYAVWRMDRDFGAAQKIVDGLRGCCGQMDIQAHAGELYVAENGRDRVVRYDRDGNELAAWGKSDRKNLEGFGSCCNPMNVRIGPDGVVYTAEASLGRIKRYTAEGEFLGLVGTVGLVPGCKHVPIGFSPDLRRFYMLDLTRSHIAVLAERDESGPDDDSGEERAGSEAKPPPATETVPSVGFF